MRQDRQPALVTGASGGIGLELARVLAANGHDLVLVARSADKLEEVARELRAGGRRVEVVVEDLADPGAPARLADEVARRGVEIGVLVNNAGVAMHGRFHELDEAGQLSMLQLNVNALTHLTRRFLPGMVARGAGRVLNVASTAGFVPGPFMAVYYATKAYVLSLSVALADELRGTGVTVTALCPGPTRTDFEARAGVSGTRLFRTQPVADAASVARAGYDALVAGRRIVVPGLRNRLLAASSGLAPRALTARIARALQDPADRA